VANFSSKSIETGEIVAVKIIHIDKSDYEEVPEAKDDNMNALITEISVLRQLRDSKARNVNALYDAFSIHSQLWIITEFCPGGSVWTLMKPFKDGLQERFIIPIARETAIGLKYIHEAGIIHRDLKCKFSCSKAFRAGSLTRAQAPTS
jgi:serine/threonine protein kinase